MIFKNNFNWINYIFILILFYNILLLMDLKSMLFWLFNLLLVYICFFSYNIFLNLIKFKLNKFYLIFNLFYYKIKYNFKKSSFFIKFIKIFINFILKDFFIFFYYFLYFFKNKIIFFIKDKVKNKILIKFLENFIYLNFIYLIYLN